MNNNSGEGEVFIHLAPESIIHISPESVIHILRNDYSLAPEYAAVFFIEHSGPKMAAAIAGRASPIATRTIAGAATQTWTLRAPALRGQTLRIRGLEKTVTDVLTRIQFLDGTVAINVLQPSSPSVVVPERQTALALAHNYILYGIQRIWFGIDHLLFVAGRRFRSGI